MKIFNFLKNLFYDYVYLRHSISSIIRRASLNAKVFDVGCGLGSLKKIRNLRKDIVLFGCDILEFSYSDHHYADVYYSFSPNKFSEELSSIPEKFDLVISNHNLEHVFNRLVYLQNLSNICDKGGMLYLAFPSEFSLDFPSGLDGSLNYFDDITHISPPPDFSLISNFLNDNGFKIIYSNKRERPILHRFYGFLITKFSMPKKVSYALWAYWGFEAKIIAIKI